MKTTRQKVLEPKRELRRPHFDGYKLNMNDVPLARVELAEAAESSFRTGNLPFPVLKHRARYNHLLPNPYDRSELLYYAGPTLCLLQFRGGWTQTVLARLAENGDRGKAAHLPTAVFAARDTIVASSAKGGVVVLQKNGDAWQDIAQLPLGSEDDCSLSILAATSLAGSSIVFVLALTSSMSSEQVDASPALALGSSSSGGGGNTTSKRTRMSVAFSVSLLRIDTATAVITTLCRLDSKEPPALAMLAPSNNSPGTPPGIVLGSSQPFVCVTGSTDSDKMDVDDVPVVPKYAWTQTSEDITVYVTLPERVTKHDIDCRITSDRVRLRVKGGTVPHAMEDVKFFSEIDNTSSVWTIEKGNLLTLHLEKDSQSRWIQLKDVDDGVLETMDPLEIAAIRDSLDKFTSNNAAADRGMQPTLDGNDEDCDLEGNPFMVWRFDSSGSITDATAASSTSECLAVSPLHNSFLAKWDVDGVVYQITLSNDELSFENVACFHAFAYVAASKRQKRLITWSPDYSTIAIADASRYVYIYSKPADDKGNKADQWVIDLGHDAGDTLGLQYVLDYQDRPVVAVLTGRFLWHCKV